MCNLHNRLLLLEDLGAANGTHVHPPNGSYNAKETLRSIPLTKVGLGVGDHITFGSAMSVIRRRALPPGTHLGDELALSTPVSRDGVVLSDPAMQILYEQADLAAGSLMSVLLLGETGVGKEVLARTIHLRSARSNGPFLAFNCAALAESLLEAELFGHEKGTFTGATLSRPGLFESAEGGTVFLDEVGDLPKSVQVKLLRVLDERQVLPVGGRRPRPINVRFVAATNCDLAAKVASDAFRSDLFFRLDGITLTIPPLRARVADIVPLARLFAAKACRDLECRASASFSAEALALLERHTWPGNVRELRNVIERAVVFSRGGEIRAEHLPPRLVATGALNPAPQPAEPSLQGIDATQRRQRPLKGTPAERERIAATLAACKGNQTKAAKLLGISRRTLIDRLKAHGFPRPRKDKKP